MRSIPYPQTNWLGVAWLEAQWGKSLEPCDLIALGPSWDGLYLTQCPEGLERRRQPGGQHVRPTVQLLPDGAFSGMGVNNLDPCPVCLDFSRTANCPEHPDKGIRGVVELNDLSGLALTQDRVSELLSDMLGGLQGSLRRSTEQDQYVLSHPPAGHESTVEAPATTREVVAEAGDGWSLTYERSPESATYDSLFRE